MITNKSIVTTMLTTSVCFSLSACPSNKDPSTNTTESTTESSTEGTESGTGTTTTDTSTTMTETTEETTVDTDDGCPYDGMGGDIANDEGCVENADCQSLACYKRNNFDPKAVCVEAPEGCNTQVVGTLFSPVYDSMASQFPHVADTTVRIVAAGTVVISGLEAPNILETKSAADGVFDITSTMPLDASIALLALVESENDGLFPTATGLAQPVVGSSYGPMNSAHDVWVISTDPLLTDWNKALNEDATLAELLPFGEKGGVVGVVRSNVDGAPLSDKVVVPVNGASTAKVRYWDASMASINEIKTDKTGLFFILGAGINEEFKVEGTEEVARVGGKDGILFTTQLIIAP